CGLSCFIFKKKPKMVLKRKFAEDSRDLLSQLNLATAEMMSLPISSIGSCEWRIAQSRQEQAFLRWHCYISNENVVRLKEPRLATACVA
ncbi:hypothetical protein QCD79_02475, partial [Pseudomonas quasicaspiana]|nr:hypothetical protein [Pseudomonas quasicaspiana]